MIFMLIFEQLLSQTSNNELIPFSSNLISSKAISISKKDNTLLIIGRTDCNNVVTKCGFSKVTIQRRKNSSSSWTTYKSWLPISCNLYTLCQEFYKISKYQQYI